MLSFMNLSIAYHAHPLITALGMTLFPGCLLCIKGTNGSGKTTLLRTIAGLHHEYTGTIHWQNQVTDTINYCYIGHQLALKLQLSVLQNLRYWAALAEHTETLSAAIHYWELEAILDKKVGELSRGWQKRIALARVFFSPHSCWLLDEPEAHLDTEGRETLYRLLYAHTENQGMALLATHAPEAYPNSRILDLQDWSQKSTEKLS